VNVPSRALLVACVTGILPSLDWSFVSPNPPVRWNAHGVYFYVTPRVPTTPEDFQSAVVSGATQWNGRANSTFWYGSVADAYYGASDGIFVVDYLGTPDNPTTPANSIVDTWPGSPTTIMEVDTVLNFLLPMSTVGDLDSYDAHSARVRPLALPRRQ
jgi:hypothetical protein